MSILVVNPPNKPFTNKSILIEPVDVLQIGTVIKRQYKDVKVIDMDVDRMSNNLNNYLDDKQQNIIIFVFDYQIPLHTSGAIDNIFEIVKNKNKECKFIIIGKTSEFYYENFINSGIDIVIGGKAEDRINDVITYIDDKDKLSKIPGLYIKDINEIIVTKKAQQALFFNEIPCIDRSLLDISKYIDVRTILTSRGCNGTCNYCSTPYFFGCWDGKDYMKVVDEIEDAVKNYKANKILFLDDNAVVNKDRMINICNEIIKRGIKTCLGCLSSIKCYNKEMFELMYKAGFRWVHIGIESGSDKILKLMNKVMDLDKVRLIIKELKDMGYRIRTSWILDYPGSTTQDLDKTIKFMLELNTNEMRLHYLAYRVGTPIFNQDEYKDIPNQYIHSNKLTDDNKLNNKIKELLNKLTNNGYQLIDKEINWEKEKHLSSKLVSLVPMRYGVDWDEEDNRNYREHGNGQNNYCQTNS